MTRPIPLTRALISVSDKTGLVEFAQALAARGVELLSTGGTAKTLREAGLSVRDVADVTGFPEMMDGRVKTLHPKVHGGLLALRDNEEHLAAMEAHQIEAIDLLVVNLYPFEETVAKGADYETCIENIDIGGPAMIRAAAKNHAFVSTVVDVEDYAAVLAELDANDGATSYPFRQRLAQIAYARTAAYDAAVSTWMAGAIGEETPRRRAFAGKLAQTLRYGENPHQQAAFYLDGTNRPGVATAKQLQGKELSYNNINDTDAAFELVSEFGTDKPAVAIIKHANPCGVATGETVIEAYKRAFDCDRTSAFGGIIALNQTLDAATAEEITKIFSEVIIAPAVDEAAKEVIAKKKNVRLLETGGLPDTTAPITTYRQVAGGFLVQDKDNGVITLDDLKVVTERQPSEQELKDLLFAWKVAKHVKSNAIIYVKDGATVGVGA
ncbi:MAG: bifunctional phosphoribosylaminoimidazolecarboxamide formyltransferase/IMP cyclohydrolase, partial [Rhodobacteraceae bacterium]